MSVLLPIEVPNAITASLVEIPGAAKTALPVRAIIMTDMCDRLICESVFVGFLMSCPDQDLCREIIPHLAPIQMREADPKDFPIATSEEMEELWAEEEAEVMQAEFGML